MPRRSAAFFFGPLVAAILVAPSVLAAEEANQSTVILDTSGFWRCHLTLQTPVVTKDGVTSKLPFLCETPPPASGWMRPDFDDSAWRRIRRAVSLDQRHLVAPLAVERRRYRAQ